MMFRFSQNNDFDENRGSSIAKLSGHKSVMLSEVVEYLNIKPGSRIIDATFNGGGHTSELLQKFPDIRVLGIEWDPEIFEEARLRFYRPEAIDLKDRLILVNDSYVNLQQIIEKHGFQPDGIIFDLGVSSWHYEKSGRGFSFQKDEVLDMRFDPRIQTKTAADIINEYFEEELESLLREYGEEKFSDQIAKAIIKSRNVKPIVRTNQLVDVIKNAVPAWYKKRKIHPATKTFQALRLAVNNELDNVEKGILTAINVLKSGGRLVVISFQGLEDKIVREIFKNKAKEGLIKWVVRGTIKPRWEEVQENPRARSAKMKVVEKFLALDFSL